ncbi:MAG: hypothetical protein IT450_18945 [Phycisphaerales bacterium]|nr:hypothetical protein [Phycisphaerales bacterium]
MTRLRILILTLVLAAGGRSVSAQIPDIPRLPGAKKALGEALGGKSEPKSGEAKPGEPARAEPAAGYDRTTDVPVGTEPLVCKDTLHITAFTFSSYKGDSAVWSWVPKIEFRVNGPIASGSVLWAEFSLPSGAWLKQDFKTEQVQAGKYWDAKGGGRDFAEDKGVTHTGPVDFTINLRNELEGKDAVLFKGRFDVEKVHSNETAPNAAQHFVYYVDQDWNLPIGYVFLKPHSSGGWKKPELRVAFWVRGDSSLTDFEPHLFYQGKEVGKVFLDGNERGRASTDREVELTPNQQVDDSLPQKGQWSRMVCDFPNVLGWDKTGEKPADIPGQTGSVHLLANHPGDYEFKLLRKGRLARIIKFTVRPDGRFDNGLAGENKLGSDRVIVPVKIMGEEDGAWKKDAWKTAAFYGNPLTGFALVH